MKTWKVFGGQCGGSETEQVVKADYMELKWGCLVFYTRPVRLFADSEIILAIGVGYWNNVILQREEDS